MGVSVFTLALMSFLVTENPFYRFAEHVYVGIAAAHSFIMGWENLQNIAFGPIINDGKVIKIIPIILGLLLYSRIFKGKAWLSQIPMSIIVGIGTGLTMRGTVRSDIINQIRALAVPLNSVHNIIVVVGGITVMMYFYFSRKETNLVFNYSGRVGRFLLMVAFGALFGNAAMGRMSLLIGRMHFLLGTWLGLT